MTFHCVRPNFAQDYTTLQNEKIQGANPLFFSPKNPEECPNTAAGFTTHIIFFPCYKRILKAITTIKF